MNINSNLRIDDIKIIESQIKLNNNFNFSQSEWTEETPVSITPEFLVNEKDERIGRVRLEVKVFDENFLEQDQPYYLRVVTQGQFSLLTETPVNVFDEYALSATSMLFPYVRSFIAAVTGLSGINSVHIPAINVVRLFEELGSQE